VIDIVSLAESYTKGKNWKTRKIEHAAFVAGAQALSVALRYDLENSVDYVKHERPVRRKKLSEGHQWFTA
jgi:hypothetical protein